MNSQNNKNFNKKKPEIKPILNSNNKGADGKKFRGNRGFQNRGFQNERADEEQLYKKKLEDESPQLYKQDLIHAGFSVAEQKEVGSKYKQVITEKPECFNQKKRQVILDKSTSQQQNKNQKIVDDVKEDFQKLIENEDVPDWYLLEEGTEEEFVFDFGNTVDKTQTFEKEHNQCDIQLEQNEQPKAFQINGYPLEQNAQDFSDLKDMDFAQLDQYLEQKAKEKNEEKNSDYEKDESSPQSEPSEKQNSSNEQSKNYFSNLQENIKNYFLNSSKEDFEDSEESFQDCFGFHYQGDQNMNPQLTPASDIPRKLSIKKDERNDHSQNDPSFNDTSQSLQGKRSILNESDHVNFSKKEDSELMITETANDAQMKGEQDKATQEEIQQRMHSFIEKYGYMDQLLNQIVYEILHSKQRTMLNKLSVNGFNQKSVEKYCDNQYKIFSLYTQGNIIPKVWFYMESDKKVQGPFMSYDMDIWNEQKNYFTENVKISLANNSGNYFSLQKYINRDPEVIQVVEEFISKNVTNVDNQQRKKSQNQPKKQSTANPQNKQTIIKNPEKVNINEEFPSLGQSTNAKKINEPQGWEDVEIPVLGSSKQIIAKQATEKAKTVQSIEKQTSNQKTKKTPKLESQKAKEQTSDTPREKKQIQAVEIQVDSLFKAQAQKEEKQDHVSSKTQKTIVKNEELTNNLKNLLGLQIIQNI